MVPRYFAVLIAFMLNVIPSIAQNEMLNGRVIDSSSQEAMEKVTIQLYQLTTQKNKRDTVFVNGTFTDEQGQFSLKVEKAGNYLLKLSSLGYEPISRNLLKERNRPLPLGTIAMKADAIQLDEAVVTANVPKMIVKDDTVVYNADAFRVPEGSVIEALVEVLPGAKIDDNGGITINGKNVKKFKMDGRDFMTGNNDAVMKNLPSYVVDKIKAYDEKSDLSRLRARVDETRLIQGIAFLPHLWYVDKAPL